MATQESKYIFFWGGQVGSSQWLTMTFMLHLLNLKQLEVFLSASLIYLSVEENNFSVDVIEVVNTAMDTSNNET